MFRHLLTGFRYGGLDIYENKNGTDAKLYFLKKAKKFQKNRLNLGYTATK